MVSASPIILSILTWAGCWGMSLHEAQDGAPASLRRLQKDAAVSLHRNGASQPLLRHADDGSLLIRREMRPTRRSKEAEEPAFVEREAGGALSCKSVFAKAMNIITAYKIERDAVRTIQGKHGNPVMEIKDEAVFPGGWLYTLEQQLETDITGDSVLEGFYRVLNDMDLGAGLRHGEVWTIQHAESFYQCNQGFGSLEVHGTTTEAKPDGGDMHIRFCGGDMVCHQSWTSSQLGASQLQGDSGSVDLTTAGPQWIRTFWSTGLHNRTSPSYNGTFSVTVDTADISIPAPGDLPENSSVSRLVPDLPENSSVDGGANITENTQTSPQGTNVTGSEEANVTGDTTQLWSSGSEILNETVLGSNATVSSLSNTSLSNVSSRSNQGLLSNVTFQNSTSLSNAAEDSIRGTLNHEVLFCFASSLSMRAKNAFMLAVGHIEEQVPCISFRPVALNTVREDCDQQPSIIVQSVGQGCWSHVGQVSDVANAYKGRSQPLNLGFGCEAKGLVVHQLGHALGLLHEIYRPDRDSMIELQISNTARGNEGAPEDFQIVTDFRTSSFDAGFDFLSVMMYGAFTFSKNGLVVAKPNDLRAVGFMGQRMGLSELDVRVLGALYGCEDNVTAADSNAELSNEIRQAAVLGASDHTVLSSSGFQLHGVCEDENRTGFFDSHGSNMTCLDLRHQCTHISLREPVRKVCPATCHDCVPGLWPTVTSKCLLCEDLIANGWRTR
jgi:hypothetical protein